jgi:hypothetical protein
MAVLAATAHANAVFGVLHTRPRPLKRVPPNKVATAFLCRRQNQKTAGLFIKWERVDISCWTLVAVSIAFALINCASSIVLKGRTASQTGSSKVRPSLLSTFRRQFSNGFGPLLLSSKFGGHD